MAKVKFNDYSAKVIAELNEKSIAWLYEVGGEIEAQAAENSPHDSGALQQHWRYIVDEAEGSCTVGNDLKYAIYHEFGTGEHALNNDGRKTPWTYRSAKDGNFYTTTGVPPLRMLFNAFNFVAPKAEAALEKKLKG